MAERDRLLDEAAAAVEANPESPAVLMELVHHLHAGLPAVAVCLWSQQPNGSFQLSAQSQIQTVLNLPEATHHSLFAMRLHVCAQQSAVALPPDRKWPVVGVEGPENRSPYAYLCVSVSLDHQAAGVLEAFLPGDRAMEFLEDDLRFLMRGAAIASRFAVLHRFRMFAGREEVWRQLDAFLRAVHSGSNLDEAAYLLANDGKRLLGCDRVMVFVRRGSRWRVRAVSDRLDAEGRSNLASKAEALLETTVRHGGVLFFDGGVPVQTPADLELRLNDYLKESASRLLVAMPLPDERTNPVRRLPISIAVLAENFGETTPPTEFAGRLEVLGKHSAIALYQAMDRERVFLYPLWRWVGEWLVWPTVRRRRLSATIAAMLLAGWAALALIPAPLWIVAGGELVPKLRRTVFAPAAGIVADIRVGHRSQLKVGGRIASIDNPLLNRERLTLLGELEAKRVARANWLGAANRSDRSSGSSLNDRGDSKTDEADRAAFRVQELDGEVELLRGKLAVVDRELASLDVSAPITGEVLTWNPQERLAGKPVDRGRDLVEIADVEGEWIVEVGVPETSILHLRRAFANGSGAGLDAVFLIASAPDSWRSGRLVQINLQGEMEAGQNVFRGVVHLTEKLPADLRLAHAEIRCRIHCGSYSLGHVLFWRVVDWARGNLWL